MKPIDSHEISHFSKSDLKALAIEQSQLLSVATRTIRNLEKQVDQLAQAVGEKNQKLFFSAEALQRMRHMQFGKSSEKRDEEDCSPLFGKNVADTEDNSAAEENQKPGDPRPPKKHPGRRRQGSLDIQDVNHSYNQVACEQHGLTPWEGQFEICELITVIPSRIILQNTSARNISAGIRKPAITILSPRPALCVSMRDPATASNSPPNWVWPNINGICPWTVNARCWLNTDSP